MANLPPQNDKYKIRVVLSPNPAKFDVSKDWILAAKFLCSDLLQEMRHGLFWTTSNIVPECGFDGKLHPKYGSWWFWPMETVLDYDELESGGTLSSQDDSETLGSD